MTVSEKLARIEEQVRRLARRLSRDLGAATERILPGAQFDLLRCLYQRGRLTVSQLARELRVTASAITALSNRLVASRLVQRAADKADRRVVWLELTEEGRALYERIHAERLERIRRYFQRVSERDLDAYVATLSELVRIIEAGSEQGEPAT